MKNFAQNIRFLSLYGGYENALHNDDDKRFIMRQKLHGVSMYLIRGLQLQYIIAFNNQLNYTIAVMFFFHF